MDELRRAIAKFGLTLKHSPKRGRGLYTTRVFSPGDLIFSVDAYASVPDNHISQHQCDGCFQPTHLVCPCCKFAYYCSQKCQESEWVLHSVECKGIGSLTRSELQEVNPTMRLAIKIQSRAKLQLHKVMDTSSLDNYALVKALVFDKKIDEGKMTLGKAKIVCKVVGETNKKEVADNLLRIIFNSSSVVDTDLGHLGKGLYLLISLMNHSCLPNCIVVFEGKKAFVRAVEPIAEGAEICQSYINLSGSTMSRKMRLEGEYLFTCTCPRCIKGEHHDILERAYVEGYRCSANGCDGALLSNSDGNEFICQKCKCLRSKEEITKLRTEIALQMKALEAAQTVGSHITILKQIETLQMEVFNRRSTCFVHTWQRIMEIAMNLKDWKEALAYCKLIIEQYQGLYPGYNHLLGLEYYRCGKFQGALREAENAVISLNKAIDILQIAYGRDTAFMKDLFKRLEVQQKLCSSSQK